MLETFTSAKQVGHYISNEDIVRAFLEDVYGYLVQRNYFKLVRQMLDEKVPPLDGPVLTPPNAISETLLQMIVHPLKLLNSCTGTCSQLILSSFIEQIISPEFSEPIKSFVLPCLANDLQFPFLHFINYLDETISNVEAMDVDQSQQQQQDHVTSLNVKMIKKTSQYNQMYSSSFLLNALLTLDQLHFDKLNDVKCLTSYIRIIASMSSNLNRLPRKENASGTSLPRSADSSDSDSDDDKEMIDVSNCTYGETEILLDVVARLNDMNRARLIVDNLENNFLDNPEVLHCLCKICHHLMLYNRSAIFEYK